MNQHTPQFKRFSHLIPSGLLAIAFTLMNCLAFTGYDTLAVRYVCHSLPYRKTALTAIVSIAISNCIGLALLSGSAGEEFIRGLEADHVLLANWRSPHSRPLNILP
jgi:uncharacterized membrane protein